MIAFLKHFNLAESNQLSTFLRPNNLAVRLR
jgi:hypothetical protein